MKTIHVRQKTDKDGDLSLRIPLGEAEVEYEVVVVLQPKSGMPEDRGWPPGYFERTFGSIDDESFVRPPQGELPRAAEFD